MAIFDSLAECESFNQSVATLAHLIVRKIHQSCPVPFDSAENVHRSSKKEMHTSNFFAFHFAFYFCLLKFTAKLIRTRQEHARWLIHAHTSPFDAKE
jgi:hypothetical protein